jgi:IclR family transcriptional regulator, KDG regulon repressor
MPRLVPAVVRATDILELFLGEESTLSAADIVQRLDLPRSTVHELLTTLVERRYLERRQDADSQYQLGSRLLDLGSRYQQRLKFAAEADTVARQVAAQCRETVHVAVLDGDEVVYISKIDSTYPVRLISQVGRRLPAHCTAVGKVLLAGLPASRINDLFQGRKLIALTEHSITSNEVLLNELAQIKRDRVGYEMCESNRDAGCVAAPVVDARGDWAAAISISVPTTRQNKETWRRWEKLATEGAAELSRRLGGQGLPDVMGIPARRNPARPASTPLVHGNHQQRNDTQATLP